MGSNRTLFASGRGESAASPDDFQWIITAGLSSITAILVTFLAYLSYTPKVDKNSPAFTTDTLPFVGSWRFLTQKMDFWRDSVQKSKTGHFSFWLGKNHVVAVSGEAARKWYLDDRRLCSVRGVQLIGHGPDIGPPFKDIHNAKTPAGSTYFQRRLLELQKTEQLTKRLPAVTRDAHTAFAGLARRPTNIINPAAECYRIVIQQSTRVFCADELSDDPSIVDTIFGYLMILRSTSSLHLMAVPWLRLTSLAYWKRVYGRWGLHSIVAPMIKQRMSPGASRANDAVQTLIDLGDSQEHIIDFSISGIFVAGANAGYLTGAMLNVCAHFQDWQEKMYQELKSVAASYAKNKDVPLVEQLDSIPLAAWEESFPAMDMCYKEAIRLWVAFPMGRFNVSPNAIPIPGSSEVLPSGSFASYNTMDVHYNEKLYPNPKKFDPERFMEGREEFKKETYGFIGWGQGRHPCLGMRWAKMQQNIILGYALAMYRWIACDENGNPNVEFDRKTDVNAPAPNLARGLQCMFVPRNQN
ncbi:cytochrome P450 [Cryphonectria parasitica EP155]|uniref:Cytochrome P450 n=1 Tax=Cryphonectria parasitica (strain ATCC 38755 / EP155) TaxID=660469 RepID=A0A9P4XYF4_CRYP1|nr:cytochrome P450 [Cryphonectria parasitica EP155]KAF3763196.1 cytochrome P450 [Cryphonectria parasitica EP155]